MHKVHPCFFGSYISDFLCMDAPECVEATVGSLVHKRSKPVVGAFPMFTLCSLFVKVKKKAAEVIGDLFCGM